MEALVKILETPEGMFTLFVAGTCILTVLAKLLYARLTKIEGQIQGLHKRVTDLQGDLAEHETDCAEFRGVVKTKLGL